MAADASCPVTLDQLRALAERSPEPVGIHERGVLLYGNERLARMLRVGDRASLIGRLLLDFVHPDDRAALIARLQSHMRVDELASAFETRMLCADGSVVYVETVSTRLDIEGRPIVSSAIRDVSARKRAEALLLRQAAVFATAQRVASFGIWTETPGSTTGPAWSPEAYRIFGLDEQSFTYSRERFVALMHPEDRERVLDARRRLVEAGEVFDQDYRIVRPDGSVRWVHGQGQVEIQPDGTRGVIGIVQDITDRRALEEQLVRSQKMEAIGRLAGGIAHDFNNLLMVMMGQVAIARRRLEQPDLVNASLSELEHAVERAAALTQQLLAFARRQVARPEILDMGTVLRDIETLIRRIIGEDVVLELDVPIARQWVRVDRSQLEQVVFNLVVNARDAMPEGGRLSIRLAELPPDAASARPAYALLEVRDEGTGIAPSLQERIFEPFFTTKEPGQGSGLGLSTVYAIVEQAGGSIELESAPGRGSIFRIRWPRCEAPSPSEPNKKVDSASEPRHSGADVLLVEDDPHVRFVLETGLADLGYRVHAADCAEQALRLLSGQANGVRVLITDVVMPGVSGPQLVRQARVEHPSLEVVLLSGYAADHVDRALLLDPHVRFMQKPVGVAELSRALEQILRS